LECGGRRRFLSFFFFLDRASLEEKGNEGKESGWDRTPKIPDSGDLVPGRLAMLKE
jgi:hypothetical protein